MLLERGTSKSNEFYSKLFSFVYRYNKSTEALYFKGLTLKYNAFSIICRREKKMGITGLETYGSQNTSYDFAAGNRTDNSKDKSADIAEFIKKFKEAHEIAAQELKEDKDWRNMSDDEWDKMLEGVDKYIDAYRERLKELKEMQDEAAQKAAAEAAPEMRTIAAAAAALRVAASGLGGGSSSGSESDEEEFPIDEENPYDKNWTKNLETDDQVILRRAKQAQEMEQMAMSKYQEVMITGETATGVERKGDITEYASVTQKEDEEPIWTIMSFSADGIVYNKCQDGKIIDTWEIKYNNPEDAQKVWDFLAGFGEDDNLDFADSKEFWEKFLK